MNMEFSKKDKVRKEDRAKPKRVAKQRTTFRTPNLERKECRHRHSIDEKHWSLRKCLPTIPRLMNKNTNQLDLLTGKDTS